MAETTSIAWCDKTFNPWEGCTKVSPGCAHCYAEARNHRFGMDNWGKSKPRRRTSLNYWKQPLKWNREAGIANEGLLAMDQTRPRIFPSLCDWLDEEVPIEWLADFLKLIHDTPNLDWLLLSKRPELFKQRVEKAWLQAKPASKFSCWLSDWFGPAGTGFPNHAPPNVWIGTSIEDQQRANERIPQLLKIPAKLRFLSVEPLLGPVDLENWVHWTIVGGESGPNSRTCHVDWIRDIVKQCKVADTKCFVKQLGANIMGREMDKWVTRIKHPKGGDPSEWSQDLRVREFPN